MRNQSDAVSTAAMDNAAKLIAWIFKKYGWTVEKNLYTHNYWTNWKVTGQMSTDLDAQSLRSVSTTAKCFDSSAAANPQGKYCPVFLLPQWDKFKALVRKYAAPEQPEAPTPPITDDPTYWAKEAWAWAMANGITDGTKPQDNITREQMITMLHRYDGVKKQ